MESVTRKVEVRISDVDTLRRHGAALMREHHAEVIQHPDLLRVDDVDWRRYYEIEERGGLLILTAWGEGKLVGYAAAFIGPHPHHSSTVVCQADVLFVTPTFRSTGLGPRLVHAVEHYAKERGAPIAFWHVPESGRAEVMLRGLGYSTHETTLSRRL